MAERHTGGQATAAETAAAAVIGIPTRISTIAVLNAVALERLSRREGLWQTEPANAADEQYKAGDSESLASETGHVGMIFEPLPPL